MQTHVKRVLARISCGRGCIRSIRPNRARDEDLHFFLKISRVSRRAVGREIDRLLGYA
jgi:hypothetical protein